MNALCYISINRDTAHTILCDPMKTVCVIPARFSSSRLPGKPLADICGKPMLWWAYSNALNAHGLDDVVCAIDDPRVESVCKELGMRYVMTSLDHPNHISRVWEVSEKIIADHYVCVNGDEPALDPSNISALIPSTLHDAAFVLCAVRELTDPAETVDFSKIKVVIDAEGRGVYMSRTPVPYPRGTLLFRYNKYVGIEVFNKQALDFFVKSTPGEIELIEDIDHLRFIENRIPIQFKHISSESISVDTPKDLEKIRLMFQSRL